MITSQINIGAPIKQNTYPLLARLKLGPTTLNSHGTIVLFTSEKAGTVIHTLPGNIYVLGEHSLKWAACHTSDTWEILPPKTTITLTVD